MARIRRKKNKQMAKRQATPLEYIVITPLALFTLLVADTGNNRIVILNGDGEFLSEIAVAEAGLNAPTGIFVDKQGDAWASDTGNERVAVFAAGGAFKAKYHRPESDFLEGYDFKPTRSSWKSIERTGLLENFLS